MVNKKLIKKKKDRKHKISLQVMIKKRRKINNNTPEILNSHTKIHKHLKEPGTETYCCGIVSLSFFTQTGHARFFCFPKPSKTSISVNQHATICNDSKFFPNDWPSSPTVNITHLNPPYDRSSDWANKVTHRPSCMFTKTDKLWQNSIPSQEMFIAN